MVLYQKFLVDSQSGMWIFRREVLDRIQLEADSMALSQEIKILAFSTAGLRCMEMPIYYGERIGESKLNLWRDGLGNLLQLFVLRLTLGRRRRAALAKVAQLPRVEPEESPPARAQQS